jgi:hypothetical protein
MWKCAPSFCGSKFSILHSAFHFTSFDFSSEVKRSHFPVFVNLLRPHLQSRWISQRIRVESDGLHEHLRRAFCLHCSRRSPAPERKETASSCSHPPRGGRGFDPPIVHQGAQGSFIFNRWWKSGIDKPKPRKHATPALHPWHLPEQQTPTFEPLPN